MKISDLETRLRNLRIRYGDVRVEVSYPLSGGSHAVNEIDEQSVTKSQERGSIIICAEFN